MEEPPPNAAAGGNVQKSDKGGNEMENNSAGGLVQLMSALAVRAPFDRAIVPAFEASGTRVEIAWNPTTVIMKRVTEGARADGLIVIADSMDELVAQGIVDPETRIEVVESRLGLAVPPGAPHPDISTLEAFRQALLDAKSVAYSNGGASGIYFKGLIAKLGIADAVNAKATVIPAGFTAEKLLTGEASLAVQQVSELMSVAGVEIVGSFPEAVQTVTSFSAALFRGAPNRAEALRFLATLRTDQAVAAYRECGLELVAV
jgi:molybdate transport system substrate-binding protein